MPRNKGQSDAILERRARVARLYCQRLSMRKIAALVGVSLGQVHADVTAARRQWQTDMAEDFARHKAEQLAGINERRAAAWRGWRRSLRDAEKRFAKTVTDAGDMRQESSKIVEGQAGDPRFLTVLTQLDEREAKLLGLDAPAKTAFTDPTGAEAATPVVVYLPDNGRDEAARDAGKS